MFGGLWVFCVFGVLGVLGFLGCFRVLGCLGVLGYRVANSPGLTRIIRVSAFDLRSSGLVLQSPG